MKRKNAIVVFNCYPTFRYNSNTIESIRYAASRWKSDFIEITTPNYTEIIKYDKLPSFHSVSFWNKIWIMENMTHYEKVLYLDMDVIVNSKAPSIFEELVDEDLAVVLDGNPGRFEGDFFKNQFVKFIANLDEEIKIYQNNIPNFNEENYHKNYFNIGVILFNPSKISKLASDFKNFILNNPEINESVYLNWVAEQNVLVALFTSSQAKIKYLDNTWNWIAPDINVEWTEDMFLGPMKPWIYHFCGTDGAKESLLTYDRWK